MQHVSVTETIKATFNRRIEAQSISVQNLQLFRKTSSEDESVSGSFAVVGKTISFYPMATLKTGDVYEMIIKGGEDGIKDEMGMNLSQDYVWSFAVTYTVQAGDLEMAMDISDHAQLGMAVSAAVRIQAKSTQQSFSDYLGTIQFSSTDAQAQLPADYTFTEADSGEFYFFLTFMSPGTHTLTISDAVEPSLNVTSHQIIVGNGPWITSAWAEPSVVAPDGVSKFNVLVQVDHPNGLQNIENVTIQSDVTGQIDLYDDGQNGDGEASDGAYGAINLTIPAETQEGTIELIVEATDRSQQTDSQTIIIMIAGESEVDITPPEIVSIVPGNGATDVPLDGSIKILFDEGIDNASISDQSIFIQEEGGLVLPGAYNQPSSDNVQWTGTQAFSAGKTYTLIVKGSVDGITDTSGNPMVQDMVSRFSTGPLLVTGCDPNAATNTDDVVVAIEGFGFSGDDQVYLEKSGNLSLEGSNVQLLDENHLIATFSIQNASPERWDVVVENAETARGILTEGFNIANEAPTITAVTPSMLNVNSGLVEISVEGANFNNTASVRFTREGEDDRELENISTQSASQLTGYCNTENLAPGKWDIIAISSDDLSGFLKDAVEVQQTATVNILRPSGGEIWAKGTQETLVWSSTGQIHHVRIFYSEDNSNTWHKIADDEENDGAYVWTVPDFNRAIEIIIRLEALDEYGGIVAADESAGKIYIGIRQLIALYEGWNLISVCLNVTDVDIISLLLPLQNLYRSVWTYYNNPGWKRYVLDGPDSLNDLDTIEPDTGYWIYMDGPATLDITGLEITDSAIPLYRGWNLVGYDSLSPKQIEEAAASMPDGTCIYGYDSVDKVWLRYIKDESDLLNSLNELEPGKGYWIYVPADCEF